jgi:hypothetical protein
MPCEMPEGGRHARVSMILQERRQESEFLGQASLFRRRLLQSGRVFAGCQVRSASVGHRQALVVRAEWSTGGIGPNRLQHVRPGRSLIRWLRRADIVSHHRASFWSFQTFRRLFGSGQWVWQDCLGRIRNCKSARKSCPLPGQTQTTEHLEQMALGKGVTIGAARDPLA